MTPPPPPALYNCEDGECKRAPKGSVGGVALEVCQHACLQDGYACVHGKCEPYPFAAWGGIGSSDPRPLPHVDEATCQAFCKPAALDSGAAGTGAAAVSTATHTPMPFTVLDEGSAVTPATSFTVSGHSSGGSMASQHFVTFSDRITGLGHIDAAPYGCSKLQNKGCKYNCACKGDAAVARMLTYAQGSADAGRIAPLSHVKAARVWVMSGGADTIVNHTVGAAAADLYRRMGADVIFHIVPGAEHAFVTDSNSSGVANPCGFLGAPFINVRLARHDQAVCPCRLLTLVLARS